MHLPRKGNRDHLFEPLQFGPRRVERGIGQAVQARAQALLMPMAIAPAMGLRVHQIDAQQVVAIGGHGFQQLGHVAGIGGILQPQRHQGAS